MSLSQTSFSYDKDNLNSSSKSTMNDKFGRSLSDRLEEEFKKNTVGLVSKDEYKKRLKSIYSESEQIRIMQGTIKKPEKKKETSKDANQPKKKAILSFEDDMDDDNEKEKEKDTLEPQLQKKKNLGKNPNVDTSFLPDKEREEKRNELRQKMSEEFLKEQEKIKEQILEVKYMLWNGLNQVKTQRIRKNNTVGGFIDLCKKTLDKENVELRQLTPDGLMFVIDDCIIPYGYTFYELLASKVKSEGGVLLADKLKEGEEGVCEQTTKPVKIVDKRVYEKSKHVFPCNSWKILDFSTLEE